MKCPSCHFEQPDDSTTCGGCGLIFAKWKERHPDPSAAPQAPAETPVEDLPTDTVLKTNRLKAYLIPAAAGIILAIVCFYFLSGNNPPEIPPTAVPPPVTKNLQAIATLSAEPTEVLFPPTPTAAVTGPPWKFRGKVLDILHLTPIAGATLVFGDNFTTVTDAQGRYEVEVPARDPERGYYAQLSHPDYGNRYWEGDWSKFSRRERVFVQGQIPFHGGFSGSLDKPVTLDFGMYPEKLTAEEQREYQDTVNPPARD